MIHQKSNGTSSRLSQTQSGLLFELEKGRFASSHRLPSERELAVLLGVSRTTLRKALAELVAQGRIEQRQGFGTFAVRKTPQPSATGEAGPSRNDLYASPGAELLQRGEAAGSKELSAGLFRPTAEETMMLGLLPDLWIRRSSRLWLSSEDKPLAHEMTVRPEAKPESQRLAPSTMEMTSSLIGRQIRRVRAGQLDAVVAGLLLLEENTIGIIIEERCLAPDGACVAFTRLSRPLPGFDLAYELRLGARDVPSSG